MQEEAKVTAVAERDVGFGCGLGEATIDGTTGIVVDVIGEEVNVGAVGDERDNEVTCGCDDLRAEAGEVDALGTINEEPSGGDGEPAGHQRIERRSRGTVPAGHVRAG